MAAPESLAALAEAGLGGAELRPREDVLARFDGLERHEILGVRYGHARRLDPVSHRSICVVAPTPASLGIGRDDDTGKVWPDGLRTRSGRRHQVNRRAHPGLDRHA